MTPTAQADEAKGMTDLLPCPFCGMKPPEDLSDTLYPTGTWWRWTKDDWRQYVSHRERRPGDLPMIRMHCTECMGGCGAEIEGHSNEEAAAKWSRRLHPDGGNPR